MEMEALRAELEELFELDELLHLSEQLLGINPEQVGGDKAKGSYVRALTEHCARSHSVEALCDAVVASKARVSEALRSTANVGLSKTARAPGDTFGPYVVSRVLGTGPAGTTYTAQRDQEEVRLKILHPESTYDESALRRFLTFCRCLREQAAKLGIDPVETLEVGGEFAVVTKLQPGQTLAERLKSTGPQHVSDIAPAVRAILAALWNLHQQGVVHGNLKLENVLLVGDGDAIPSAVLLDAGTDRLRPRRGLNGSISPLAISSPKTVAPEILTGGALTTEADVYAVGTILYELLTGKAPFAAGSALELASLRLSTSPTAPSDAAPKGAIPFELDAFILRLLSRDPEHRPADADAALTAFDALMSVRSSGERISEEDLSELLQALTENPTDEEAALALESAVDEGGDAVRIAHTFYGAAQSLGEEDTERSARIDLSYRAGRLFRRAGELESAEQVYADVLERDPSNRVAQSSLEELRRRMGKYDELIETWLMLTEHTENSADKAYLMAKIGALYDQQLQDSAQALVAYTQAYCENPQEKEYAQALEKLAGKDQASWLEVLESCAETARAELAPEDRVTLLVRMGHWYVDHLNRLDLALECFRNVLGADAANEGALDGLSLIYKKTQQWQELAKLSLHRADAAPTPELARKLRVEAAEILDRRLGDTAQALQILERIIDEDPTHSAANEALAVLYQRTGDHAAHVQVLKRQAEAMRGGERLSLLCKIAEAYEDDIGSPPEAMSLYRSVVAEDPLNLGALKGLDRVYSQLGQYDQLLSNLQDQAKVATTPRQKADLQFRIAALYEEEFLDLAKAGETLRAVLELSPRHEGALTAIERVYRTQERWDELLEIYGRHASHAEDPKQRAELLYRRAKLLAEKLGSPHQAIVAYEAVLEVTPDHGDALAALAELKQRSGDADEALRALDALAENATTPAARADNYIRSARLLEKHHDLSGACERYKLALDAVPHHAEASSGLRRAYIALGDANAASELLQRQIEATESATLRGKLTAELARLAFEELKDYELAQQAATVALEWNDTAIEAQEILGRVALEEERFDDAAQQFQRLMPHLDSLPGERAVDILLRSLDALGRKGDAEAALSAVEKLRSLAPNDPKAMLRAAGVVFDHGADAMARNLYTEVLERFEDDLSEEDRALATYHHAEATRRTGELGLAVSLLEEAAELAPNSTGPLESLVKAFVSLGDWEEAWEAQSRLLDLVQGDDKVQLLIEMGELAMDKLKDRQRATRCLVAAVDVRPEDRRLLTRLMQLYSEEKDWAKAVDVVLKLAQFVDDPKQKARYLMTAGMVSAREMHDYDAALHSFTQVMALDPSLTKALEESISIVIDQGNFERAEELLKNKMTAASQAKDTNRLLETFIALGKLYRDHLERPDDAIDAFEAAHTLEPDNWELVDTLGAIYAHNPGTHFEKAVEAYTSILTHDPYRADAYSALRKLYTEVKNPDGAWLLCQALSVLKLAAPDEERFYKRMRSEDPAFAQDVLTPEDWSRDLLHPEQDPQVTDIFAVIEPAVVYSRGYEFSELGYDPRYQVNLEHHQYPIGQTIHYAAGVMDMVPPPCFENTNDPGGLVFLDTKTPAISMGVGILNAHLPPQTLAFVSGHHLSYYRPGHFLRQLVGTGTGLKSWLFAAIKLISPGFPVAPDLEGAVAEATATLQNTLGPQSRDDLARAVSKLLLASASLDLKKWVTAVDFSADRVGLLLAHDLESAVEVIQGSDDAASQRRLKEMVLFAISPNYLRLRERLGINLAI